MTAKDTRQWLSQDASQLHRRVFVRIVHGPAPTIEIARDLDVDAWDISCCLQDLRKKYQVGERDSDSPQHKREYIVTEYGERLWQSSPY